MAYSGTYKTPTDLICDDNISREEKIAMLEAWRDDKKALLRASDEGMVGVDRPDYLKQIKKALAALKDGSLA